MSSSASLSIEEKQIQVNGLKINYKRIGNGNIPVVLLHGWGVNSDKYIETAKQLSIEGCQYSIFLPDLPGFGKSDDPPEAWGVDNYAGLVKKISDVLGLKKIILIGHSFGGRIAIKFSVKYPQMLEALILTGAAGIKHSPTIKQKIFFILAKTGKAVFALPLVNRLEKPAQRLLYRAAREKDYYQAQGIVRETFKKVIDEDLSPCLEKIKIPTLLIWGRNDHSTPVADGRLMSLKIINCKLKIVDEANHSLPYQIPEKFAKIVMEFIKKT
jgi:pimeloyl-ACP methyl ester carboxylesterase